MKFKKIAALLIIFSFAVPCVCGKTFYSQGKKGSMKIALTFDDGPGASTLKILEILKKKNVKATFFLLGRQVEKNPNKTRMIAEDGHEIASHTYSHLNFYSYKEEDKYEKIEEELLKAQEIIEKTAKKKPFLARYPYGYAGADALEIAEKNGYFVINWVFGCDWERNASAQEMHERYLKELKSGVIYLMHDAPENSKVLDFLEDFIDEIEAKGYKLATISELLGLSPDAAR